MKKAAPPKIDSRVYALLFAVRHGHPPWSDDAEVDGAFESNEPDEGEEWLMCCGHAYASAEIEGMEAAGWIRTDGPRDHFGRRETSAGPLLDAALARFVN